MAVASVGVELEDVGGLCTSFIGVWVTGWPADGGKTRESREPRAFGVD
jgi:hypothetical protein